jgi:rhodanese-related sulfurtransferase
MERMEYAALAVAIIALIVALIAKSSTSGVDAKIEDARTDARRRAENTAAEVDEKLEGMRRLMAQMASGAKLTPEMILEGRLWRDASPVEGAKMVAGGGVHVVDVRTPRETAAGFIAGARLIPIDEIESRAAELPKDGKPMLVYCAGGGRSAAACEFLSRQGFANLYNLEGGFQSWSGPTARS